MCINNIYLYISFDLCMRVVRAREKTLNSSKLHFATAAAYDDDGNKNVKVEDFFHHSDDNDDDPENQ